MGNYRKKPVVIDAFKLGVDNIPDWFMDAVTANNVFLRSNHKGETSADIATLEGWHHANYGDYIIRGVKGELYPCKPDIFDMTYEAVDGYISNADRFRAMSDEELMQFLFNEVSNNTICSFCVPTMRTKCKCDGHCKNGILEWLKQPAEVDG